MQGVEDMILWHFQIKHKMSLDAFCLIFQDKDGAQLFIYFL